VKKKRIVILAWVVGVVGLVWVLTLGLHYCRYVRAYCEGHEAYGQPEVYVIMEPANCTFGIPWVHTQHRDVLPYPLKVLVTVDDRVPGQGAVIESMEVEYADGEKYPVIPPDCARGGPFAVFEPVASDQVPGRTFRKARIDIARAIWRRGSFRMVIKGYVYGDAKVPFERRLWMSYRRETILCIGWWLLVMEAAG
jgi:hypothetical protein